MDTKYKFTDCPDGFIISGIDREPVRTTFTGKNFCVERENYRNTTFPLRTNNGIFDYPIMMKSIADILMSNWKAPAEHQNKKCRHKLANWAKNQTVKALSKRVHVRWRALVDKADPKVVQAQRCYFAATGKCHSNLFMDDLYTDKNKFVLSDICKYRAAALTVSDMSFNYGHTKKFQGWEYGGREYGNHTDNWMHVYSGGSNPNTSLRKTLMNLPGGMPYGLLKNLVYRDMERPIFTRPELLAYVAAFDFYAGKKQRMLNVLRKSNAEQIRKAVKMVAMHLRQSKPRLRKANYIIQQLSYIFDCDEPHNGAITGMAEKSIRWHRAGNYNRERANCGYDAKHPTKLPPIPLPESKCVRFLDTVDKIWAESAEMSHCVSGYAPAAVEGKSFLFHVDYGQDSATVEVSPAGYVTQARGPHNSNNKAVVWGERFLAKWAEKFAEEKQPVPF